MERVLVTGGAGFIGSNVAAALAARANIEVVVVDDFSSGDWHNLLHVDCELRPVACDDPALLDEVAAGRFSAVVHQAAITDTTITDQRLMLAVNTDAFARLLEASAKGSTRMVYASSAGTYGNSPAPNRIGEGELPENIYGFSKLAMDRVARRWFDRHPQPVVGLRYFNVYGPGEAHKGKTASMILQLYEQIRAGLHPRLFKYGEQRRDFVYIRDIVTANMAALAAPRSGICNVGSGTSRTFNDIIQNMEHLLHQALEVDYFDNPYAFYQEHTEADLSATSKLLAWEPAWALEDGMAEYIKLLQQGDYGPLGGKT